MRIQIQFYHSIMSLSFSIFFDLLVDIYQNLIYAKSYHMKKIFSEIFAEEKFSIKKIRHTICQNIPHCLVKQYLVKPRKFVKTTIQVIHFMTKGKTGKLAKYHNQDKIYSQLLKPDTGALVVRPHETTLNCRY